MTDAQLHRGPDDGGSTVILGWRRERLALGNRRLAIQDLSPLGHQPMVNEATGDILVYNGEIYNAPTLRDRLKTDGFQFRGHSDTEILLRAYERWGTECLRLLRGMFAFALVGCSAITFDYCARSHGHQTALLRREKGTVVRLCIRSTGAASKPVAGRSH